MVVRIQLLACKLGHVCGGGEGGHEAACNGALMVGAAGVHAACLRQVCLMQGQEVG